MKYELSEGVNKMSRKQAQDLNNNYKKRMAYANIPL